MVPEQEALILLLESESGIDSLKPHTFMQHAYLEIIRKNLPGVRHPRFLGGWLEHYHQQKLMGAI
ncbi:hypothetical protein AMP2_gp080 [Pseudomonas phage vB_Pae_AM.P2]|uniref:Uncharacterized protein n=1 Tax=Pseudomonas phage vB_Pae_AM.P2 TaxID=2731695 RepID=A0A7S5W9C7_9CAUD|nr:hypothetical protein AMP2_gp080 [Pseudomonas phage vB_Pae_AM.P2]